MPCWGFRKMTIPLSFAAHGWGLDAIRHAIMCDSANMFAETGCDLGAPGLWHDAGDVALEQLSGSMPTTPFMTVWADP